MPPTEDLCYQQARPRNADRDGRQLNRLPLPSPLPKNASDVSNGDYCDDYEDRNEGFKRGKGDIRGKGWETDGDTDAISVEAGADGGEVASGGVSRGGFLATGFADGFERLEDQEAGYAAFAMFLVRVLDQMP